VFKEGGNAPQGTDMWAVNNGYVSVTPMRLGETDTSMLDSLRTWMK
jgi:broad specificity polyphosphatase/5'/3'-nucleotidase SurE